MLLNGSFFPSYIYESQRIFFFPRFVPPPPPPSCWRDTRYHIYIYVCVCSLPRPEFETLGLEPWESSLEGRPTLSKKAKPPMVSTVSDAPTEESLPESIPTAAFGGGRDAAAQRPPPPGPAEERDHLVRLTDSLSRGVWPTYARLACALNLLALRAMHAQLCGFLASLIWRPDYRARAPLAARVCGAVPFHPAGEGGQALGSTEQDFLADSAKAGKGGAAGAGGDGSSASSSTFYSAFLHPLYVWAQCLDRQFYAQVRFCLLLLFVFFCWFWCCYCYCRLYVFVGSCW